MKKKLLAVAVVGALASPVAFAQTLYGIVDVGYLNAKYTDANSNKHFIASGQHSTSRFGVRGSEDLGAGMYAMYQYEWQIGADDGSSPSAGGPARLSIIGLGSKAWGELTLGRQLTHTFHTWALGSASVGTFAAALTVMDLNYRFSNSVKYSSPVMGGFSVGAMWSPGHTGTPASGTLPNTQESTLVPGDGRAMDLAVRYAPGPFGVGISRMSVEMDGVAAGREEKDTQFSGHFDNRAFGIYGNYVTSKQSGTGATEDLRQFGLSGVARFGGRHELYAMWTKLENKAVASADSTLIGIVYQHVMSKRTRLYTGFGRTSNDALAATTMNFWGGGPVAAGYDPRGFQLGMTHSF